MRAAAFAVGVVVGGEDDGGHGCCGEVKIGYWFWKGMMMIKMRGPGKMG
jgi:hypothetical protein